MLLPVLLVPHSSTHGTFEVLVLPLIENGIAIKQLLIALDEDKAFDYQFEDVSFGEQLPCVLLLVAGF